MNIVSKNQKLIKTAYMGTFFTANRFRKKELFGVRSAFYDLSCILNIFSYAIF